MLKQETECSICTDTFSNPKILPYFHTFCLKCIEHYGEDQRDGDTMTCPLCRGEFEVPVGGMSKLRSNYFLERWIAAVESVESVRKYFCQKHATKELKLYCHDCRISICGICFKTKHNKHEISEIEEIAKEFKKDYLKYADEVSKVTGEHWRDDQSRSVEQIKSFEDNIELLKTAITCRGEDIKRMIDKQTNDLLGEVRYYETLLLERIRSTEENLKRGTMTCDTFTQHCARVVEAADAVEVVNEAQELKTRAKNLKKLPLPEVKELPRIEFVPSDCEKTSNQGNMHW